MRVKNGLNILFFIYLFSALGFKISSGLRTDHVTTYLFFLLNLIALCNGVKINKNILLMSLFFLGAFVFSMISDLVIAPNRREISVIQAAENLFNPFAIFFSFSLFVRKIDHVSFQRYILLFTCLVSLIGIFSFISPDSSFFNYLASGVGDEDAVRTQSLNLGRYLGIFNQPLESGLFHGAMQIMIVYLLIKSNIKKRLLLPVLILNGVAGFLSLSKSFYVLSIAVIFLLLMIFKKGKQLALLTALIIATILLSLIVFTNSSYIESLYALYDDYGFLMAVTAGRFGTTEATGVTELFSLVWNHSPLLGYGLGTHLPLDNGFLEYYFQGGLLAILPILLFLIYQFRKALMNFNSNEGKFLFCFLLFLVFASFGGPVFTANKANIAIISIITFANIKLEEK